MQQTPDSSVAYTYDRQAREMCDALARALRVSYVIVGHVYETRLVVYVGGLTTLKLVFRRWLQKFQHHKPTCVAKDR